MSRTSSHSEVRDTFGSGDSGIDSKNSANHTPTPLDAISECASSMSSSKCECITTQRMRLRTTKTPAPPIGRERLVDVDTVLWAIVFAMMVYFFNLPSSIWFSPRTFWPSIYLSVTLFGTFWSFGFIVFQYESSGRKMPRLFKLPLLLLATVALLVSVLAFCHGTWLLFNLWSVYIAFVSLMFTYSVSPVIVACL